MIFNLHELGWYSFQQLCLTVAREILGQSVESFLDTSDAGQDGAFAGIWTPRNGEALSGRFVIQCKFTSKRNRNLALSDLADEFQKIRKLVSRKSCDSYVLITNAGISGQSEQRIKHRLECDGVKQVALSPDQQIQIAAVLALVRPRGSRPFPRIPMLQGILVVIH